MKPSDPDQEIKPGNILFFGSTGSGDLLWDITPYFVLEAKKCNNIGEPIVEWFHKKWILRVIAPYDSKDYIRAIFHDEIYLII